MTGKNYETGCVLIEDRIIKKISSNIDVTENNDDTVLDVNGAWVLPGLIDAHSHIGIFEEKKGKIGDSSNEITEPITPYIKAVDAVNPMDSAFHSAIKTGVTSVMVGPGSSNVVGGQFVYIKANGRCIDNMVVMEPAAMKIAFGENPMTNYGNNNQMPSSRMTIGSMLREELFVAKQYADSKNAALDSGDGFEEDFRKECWLPVFKKDIPLKAHVHKIGRAHV